MPFNPRSLENLRPAKKGDVRNPEGHNGWTKARMNVKRILEADSESLASVLVDVARKGDVNALKLALSPFLPDRIEVTGADGGPISFADLAKKAAEEPPDDVA